jgi:hypothetical protein
MPLSPSVPREPSHTRAIVINGYRRSDGLFDIEAQLTDTKSYGFTNEDRGYIASGVPLHGMWMRMTVADDMTVVACEAASDHTPYAICPTAAPNFARLAGLRITRGFLREANMRIGGTHGCTHLRELLQQMATTALQTVNPHRAKRAVDAEAKRGIQTTPGSFDKKITERWGGAPSIMGTCVAYGTTSPVVKRRWPHLYTGAHDTGLNDTGPNDTTGPNAPQADIVEAVTVGED